MSDHIVAIDPGMETGIVEAIVDAGRVRIVGREQIVGGLNGLTDIDYLGNLHEWDPNAIVYEKFSPLPTSRAYKLAELEPIRIEGAIESYPWIGAALAPQRTSALTIAGTHGDYRANKKAADNLLRECGLWTLPREIERPDANDVNAAMKHLVAFGRAQGWQDPHEWKIEKI
jgi:hypothetical protein